MSTINTDTGMVGLSFTSGMMQLQIDFVSSFQWSSVICATVHVQGTTYFPISYSYDLYINTTRTRQLRPSADLQHSLIYNAGLDITTL